MRCDAMPASPEQAADMRVVPKWALIAHKAGAWKMLSRREVRRIANDTDMQEAIVTAWRMNANKGVMGILNAQLWEGSR